jgi:two-component system NtrC family sensor kinase
MMSPGAIAVVTLVCVAAGFLLALVALLQGQRARLVVQVNRLKPYRSKYVSLLQAQRTTERSAVRQYWAQFSDLAAPVLVTTPGGTIVAANRALLAMLGYSDEAELKRLNAIQLYVVPTDRDSIRAMLKANRVVYNKEVKLKRKDGVELDVLTSIRVVEFSGAERFYEGVCTDISELRRAAALVRKLEAKLHVSQKLESIGQLASGIAHEINTPIQFIGDNVHFLRSVFSRLAACRRQTREAVPSHGSPELEDLAYRVGGIANEAEVTRLLRDADEAFAESIEGLERVTETVRAMKEFAHPGDGEVSSVDLNHSITTTLVVARNEYKQVADVVTEFGDLPLVACRPGAINTVLLNIIVNAAHAIERKSADGAGRGVITIRTTCERTGVSVSIADTGCGIPSAVIGKIFDPFFTTKPVGRGTGQGLAIARSVVESHGGWIDVKSAPGVGTEFKIYLPVTDNIHSSDLVAHDHSNAATDPT